MQTLDFMLNSPGKFCLEEFNYEKTIVLTLIGFDAENEK